MSGIGFGRLRKLGDELTRIETCGELKSALETRIKEAGFDQSEEDKDGAQLFLKQLNDLFDKHENVDELAAALRQEIKFFSKGPEPVYSEEFAEKVLQILDVIAPEGEYQSFLDVGRNRLGLGE